MMRIIYRLILIICCYLFYFSHALAIDKLAFQIADITQPAWSLKNIDIELNKILSKPTFFINAKQFIFKNNPLLSLKQIKFDCKKAIITQIIRCNQGAFSALHQKYGKIKAYGNIAFNQKTQYLSFNFKKINFAKFSGSIKGFYQKNYWGFKKLQFKGQLANLKKHIPALFKTIELSTGEFNVTINARGFADRLSKLKGLFTLNQLEFSESISEIEAAELAITVKFNVLKEKSSYSGKLNLSMNKGMLLTPFIYLEVDKKPFVFSSNFIFKPASKILQLKKGKIDLPKTLSGVFDTQINPLQKNIQALNLKISNIQLDSLFKNNLQPVLAGDIIEAMSISGQADLSYKIKNNQQTTVALHLYQGKMSIKDDDKVRLLMTGLNAQIYLPRTKQSTLSWHGGRYEKINMGAGKATFRLDSNYFELINPLTLSIFDGAILVNQLKIEKTSKDLKINFDGQLKPISMTLLTQALDLPEMTGSIGGIIPNITYENDVLTIGGAILLRLFDGQIVIKRLRLSGLLGYEPILESDVSLKKINLEKLTKTFSFGRITGGLEGSIKGLVMQNWRPIAFDAIFKTPKKDSYKHRISQRAVENISDLGGTGAAGALSRTFLSVFEDFIYSQLGFSCKLANGICQMNGVIPAKNGFYLVKGWGLPRIDIIGFNQRIKWTQFIQQLQSITTNGEPEIK